jgi:hypothetical protein
MKLLRQVRVFVLIFAVLALVLGFKVLSSSDATGLGCCWVLSCTMEPPIVCWEACYPCPRLPR